MDNGSSGRLVNHEEGRGWGNRISRTAAGSSATGSRLRVGASGGGVGSLVGDQWKARPSAPIGLGRGSARSGRGARMRRRLARLGRRLARRLGRGPRVGRGAPRASAGSARPSARPSVGAMVGRVGARCVRGARHCRLAVAVEGAGVGSLVGSPVAVEAAPWALLVGRLKLNGGDGAPSARSSARPVKKAGVRSTRVGSRTRRGTTSRLTLRMRWRSGAVGWPARSGAVGARRSTTVDVKP